MPIKKPPIQVTILNWMNKLTSSTWVGWFNLVSRKVLTVSDIAGTTNQITVTDDGDETITLSTPQDLDTGADVEFGTVESGAFYIGDKSTNGSWRLIASGNDLNIEKREAGVWVEKMSVNP